jgi:hypothetical protein
MTNSKRSQKTEVCNVHSPNFLNPIPTTQITIENGEGLWNLWFIYLTEDTIKPFRTRFSTDRSIFSRKTLTSTITATEIRNKISTKLVYIDKIYARIYIS